MTLFIYALMNNFQKEVFCYLSWYVMVIFFFFFFFFAGFAHR